MRFILSLCAVLFLAGGCATLSKDECMSADWHFMGVKDGTNGESNSRFTKYQDSCAEYGIIPNQELYTKGREEGLKTYCTADNGYQEGIRGNTYHNVCPPELEAVFYKRYQVGYEIYSLNYKLDTTESDITRLENQLDTEKDSNRRNSIRWEIRDLRRKKDEIQRRLMVLEINAHRS